MTRQGTPAEQLTEDLLRMRAVGLTFDVAWERGFTRVRWPHDTCARRGWKAILEAQRPVYERAYAGAPADRRAEAAAALVPA